MLVQALYQMQIAGHDSGDIAEQFIGDKFNEHPDAQGADFEYFSKVLAAVASTRAELDEAICSHGDIAVDQVDPIERAVLWVALAELRECDDVPPKVVINEAIELAKLFGAEGGYRFVNGLLDKAAAQLR